MYALFPYFLFYNIHELFVVMQVKCTYHDFANTCTCKQTVRSKDAYSGVFPSTSL